MGIAEIKDALTDLSRLVPARKVIPLPERTPILELDASASFRTPPRIAAVNSSNRPRVQDTLEACADMERRLREMVPIIIDSSPEWGYIYVADHPEEIAKKVGKNQDNPFKRVAQLNTGRANGVFRILYCQLVPDHDKVELIVHKLLGRYRVDSFREFFDCPLETIILAVKTAVASADQRQPT